jgi:hypothetical protein
MLKEAVMAELEVLSQSYLDRLRNTTGNLSQERQESR